MADDAAGSCDATMIVASMRRASRAARAPDPSEVAQDYAWRAAARTADELEARGLVRAAKQRPISYQIKPTSGRTACRDVRKAGEALDSSTPSRPTAALSHVFSLQRPIDAGAREASFLTFQSILPLEAVHLAAAGMRSNSVRASLVHKAKKTQGGGQQTTRNNLGDLSAAWAAQSVAVSLALGVANFTASRRGAAPKNPAATTALDTASLVIPKSHVYQPPTPEVFLVTSSTRLLPHALPTRLCANNFLDAMRLVAQSELEMGTLRSVLPQQLGALNAVCNHIVDRTDGVSIWAAWVLLVHMLSDPRLRRMVKHSGVSDMEAATANLFQNYARAEVTRRARMDATSAAKRSKGKKGARKKGEDDDEEDEDDDEDDDEGEGDDDDDAVLAHMVAKKVKVEAEVKTEAEASRPLPGVDAQAALRSAADKQTLALKRKRHPASGVVQVSGGFLDYWAAALSSEYASILRLMITQSKELASSAAVETLSGQAPPGFHANFNSILVDISSRNAVRSAEALSGLVVTTPERVPQVVSWRCRDHANRLRCHVGVARSKADASNTTLHACSLASPHLQPRENHQVCVWSHGVRNTTPHDAHTSLLPGVAEGALHLHCLETMRDQFASRHHLTRVFDTVKTRTARAASDGSLDVTLTGIARGILVIRARLVVGDSHVKAGEAVADQLVVARQEVEERSKETQSSDFESCTLLNQEPLAGIPEPYATPSNNLALALQVNEQVRVLMKNKSHRGDPCRHLVGQVTSQEMQEACVEEYDKPQTLLPIVDCKVDFLEDPTLPGEELPNRRDATLRKVAITLTVCGDSPVRLPELLDVYGADVRAREMYETNRFFQLLALTWAGAARASELNDVAASVTAGHVNSSIASAKRILVGDLNLRTWLTHFQVYRVGTSNVPRSHETTPWSGTCGAGFDIGTSGGIGIRASSITADKRNHGKILMAQEQVDEWSNRFAENHYVPVSDKEYAAIPREARGIPHYTVPGLHAYLNHYADAMEHARTLLGITGKRTVDSLQCLPFGPFAERQAPHVAEGSDPTTPKRFRNPEDSVDAQGRAFQVDSTCADVAIFREPLIPVAAITSPQDCIFGQAQPFLASVISAAALLAQLGRTARLLSGEDDRDPKAELDLLYRLLDAFYAGDEEPPVEGCSYYLAASAAVVLNTIFVSGHQMADPILLDAHARAPARCAKKMREQISAEAYAKRHVDERPKWAMGAPLPDLVPPNALKEARAFWAPFARADERTSAWAHLAPLVLLLSETDGSYDLDIATLDRFSVAVDRLLRQATWFHASPDGAKAPVAPSPLEGVRAYTQVRSEHILPVFVGSMNELGQVTPARGALCGCVGMQFQQILALLTAAARNDKIVVNALQNFSYLTFRVSAAPDILTQKGKPRSAKAVSPVNVDGDEAAYGTREDKMRTCKLHRKAYKTNLDFVLPLCLDICPPRSDNERARGDLAQVDYVKHRKRQLDGEGMLTNQEITAAQLFAQAAKLVGA